MNEKIQKLLDGIVAELGKNASASLTIRVGGTETQFVSSGETKIEKTK
jgi:hypothetical protein